MRRSREMATKLPPPRKTIGYRARDPRPAPTGGGWETNHKTYLQKKTWRGTGSSPAPTPASVMFTRRRRPDEREGRNLLVGGREGAYSEPDRKARRFGLFGGFFDHAPGAPGRDDATRTSPLPPQAAHHDSSATVTGSSLMAFVRILDQGLEPTHKVSCYRGSGLRLRYDFLPRAPCTRPAGAALWWTLRDRGACLSPRCSDPQRHDLAVVCWSGIFGLETLETGLLDPYRYASIRSRVGSA